MKGLLREAAVVRVGCFDTEFYGFQEIRSEKDIAELEIKGSGGTNFETAVKAFSGDAETKIVFTDGYADMPETRCDAIWLVYSDMPVDPPGGRVIYVKKPEDLNNYGNQFSYHISSCLTIPLPLFRTVGTAAQASDLAMVTAPDDGFTFSGYSVNYFLSGGECC